MFWIIVFHVTGTTISTPEPAHWMLRTKQRRDTLCVQHEEQKNKQSNLWTNPLPGLPYKLQRWQLFHISNLCLHFSHIYRGNHWAVFRHCFPKAFQPLIHFPFVPSSLENLPLSGLHNIWQATDEVRLISKKLKHHQHQIGTVRSYWATHSTSSSHQKNIFSPNTN